MPQSHEEYERERQRQKIAEEARKLEQQRKDALRQAEQRGRRDGKTPDQIRKDQEALNAFYGNRARSNQRRGGKPDTCMLILVLGAAGLGSLATAVAQAIKAFS